MRKSALIPLLAVLVALGAATVVLYQKLQHSTAAYATMQSDAQATQSRYGKAIEEIAAIQDSLSVIASGKYGEQALATQLQTEENLSRSESEEAMARIAQIKAGIARTRDRIAELEKSLQQSNVKMTGLQKMIDGLRKSVTEKEAVITELTQRVDALQTEVTGLNTQVQEGQETIQAQAERLEDARREMGTIYYTIGTKKELSNAGMVTTKGGVLGFGKTLKLTGQLDESRFTPLDTDAETVIHIPAPKARVLSDQPVASYELQPAGEQWELHILDPKAFRAVKHVVIVTT